jgi:hypothetical protein
MTLIMQRQLLRRLGRKTKMPRRKCSLKRRGRAEKKRREIQSLSHIIGGDQDIIVKTELMSYVGAVMIV